MLGWGNGRWRGLRVVREFDRLDAVGGEDDLYDMPAHPESEEAVLAGQYTAVGKARAFADVGC